MKRIALAFALALAVALLVRWTRARGGNPGESSAEEPKPVASGPTTGPAVPANPAVAPRVSESPVVARNSGGCICESANGASLKWMVRHQNPDGSWGGDAEIFEGRVYSQTSATALCLLSLLSAGYCHLTKEGVSIEGSDQGKSYGETIKAALKWLDARPPTDGFDAALSALAMSEAFGLTSSKVISPMSEAALARYDAFQRFDATRGDPLAESWCAFAATSARLSSLEFDEAAAERTVQRLKDSLETAPSPEAAAAYLLFSQNRDHASLPDLAANLAASPPDWEKPEFTRWYFGTVALFQYEGPTRGDAPGESWKTWSENLKEALVRHQQREGTWPGLGGATSTAVRTALGTLSLEVYYRYSASLGVK
jgi:hypothetical protein